MRATLVRATWPVVALAALIPAGRDAWRAANAPAPARTGLDGVARYASAKRHLRAAAVVCYVPEPLDLVQAQRDPAVAARAQSAAVAMFLAQRALAPTLVRPEPNAAWVLVDYDDRARVPPDWAERGLELVDDPGTGVVLFRVKGR